MKVHAHKTNCDHHKCNDKSCEVKAPHAHTFPGHQHDSCLTCVRDHKNNVFPLQEKISRLKINNFLKQIFITTAFLGTAIPIAKVLSKGFKYLDFNSFISRFIIASSSVTTMHVTNRGFKNFDKLGLTVGSSAVALGLRSLINTPRFLLRSLMCFAVFFIERLIPDELSRSNNHTNKTQDKLNKKDFMNFSKVQMLILSIPSLIDYMVDKLSVKNSENNNFILRSLGNIGITVFHVLGLSLGFVALGKLFDFTFKDSKLKSNGETTAGKTESVVDVCAHCGVPGCIDSITEGVDASIIQTLAA